MSNHSGTAVLRGWLAGCLLACMGGWALAQDGEPGFPNYAQLASIEVGGVAASYPVGGLSEDPLHVTPAAIAIGHCAAQRIVVQGWQPSARVHVVRVAGQAQALYLDEQNPFGTLDVPLAFGPNTVQLRVQRNVALNATATATYTLNIMREGPGAQPDLAALALSSGVLSPPFAAANTRYSATVAAPSVALVPVAADCPEITINGQAVASGSAAQLPLALGPNEVQVQSTAQDGSTRTYQLTLTRTASSDAGLQGLVLSAATLSPAFDPAMHSYTATVPYAVASVALMPFAVVPTATFTIDGAPAAAGVPYPVALQVGANPIVVRVLAEDGVSEQTYTVNVIRAEPDANAHLAALVLSDGAPSPAFDPGVARYTASVASAVQAIAVTPTPAFAGASVTVNGTPAAGGGVSVPLSPGVNTVAIQVTAQDGTTQLTYTLQVVRASPVNSAKLLGLALSSGTPWPPVHPAITAYTARAASSAATLTLTPTLEDPTAAVRINGGVPLAPGEVSALLPLAPGHNLFTIEITSTDGRQTGSYTLDVLRGQAEAALAGLTLSDGRLSPAFAPAVLAYGASVPYVTASVRVGVTLADPEATVRVAGRALRSGHAAAVALAPGLNTVPVQVTSSDGTVRRSHLLSIMRQAPQAVPLEDNPVQFTESQALPDLPLAGGRVLALAARDIDGDGLPDIQALDAARPDLGLLANQGGQGGQGGARFGAVQWQPLGVAFPGALALGDFLGQGGLDVLAVGSSQSRLAVGLDQGLGNAQWLMHPETLAETFSYANPVAHDVDADGLQDLLAVSSGSAVVRRSLGNGSFAPAQVVGGLASLKFVVAGDFDGNGHADLALVGAGGNVRVLPGLPQGGFGTHWDGSLGGPGISAMVAGPHVADFDGDGRDDLAVAVEADGMSTLAVLRGLAEGGFSSPLRFASGLGPMIGQERPLDLAVADFNGDGRLDVAVLNGNGSDFNVAILRGQGDGRFAAPLLHPVPWLPGRMAVADFDGDGKPDLVLDAAANKAGGLKVLRNTAPDLAQVLASSGTLVPAFNGGTLDYLVQLPPADADSAAGLALTPWLAFGTATVRIGGVPVASGSASPPVAVPATGDMVVTMQVQARDGSMRVYTFTATRSLSVSAIANPAQGGTASCVPSRVERGGSAACTATARGGAGYRFAGWTGACAGQGADCILRSVQAAQASEALFTQHHVLALPEGPQARQPLELALQSGNGWQLADVRAQTSASLGAELPAGVTLPHGVLRLRLDQGMRGSQATVVLTYPQALPQGAVYYKYGKTADEPRLHWYPFPGAAISGRTVTLTLRDGGAGDGDLAENAVIDDPGGPALVTAAPSAAAAIPTLGAWGALLLSLLACGLGLSSLVARGRQIS